MGKPVDKGRIKMRADEYVCPACGYAEKKQEHEESLIMEAQYTCPKCGKEGESSVPYIREKVKGIPAYVVECQYCRAKIPLTKKLKELKK